MKVLDLSAGNRAIWFDKAHPCATYVDIRPEVQPDIIADSRALPADIGGGYSLIVFDPPHKNNAATGNMVRNYGHWTHAEIREIVGETAKEAHRVSADNALMAFKWNDHSLRLQTVLGLLAPFWEPLFGHGVTHQQKGTSWVMLRRIDCFNPPMMARYFVSQYTDGPATRWNVIDRQTQEWIRRFATEDEAEQYAASLSQKWEVGKNGWDASDEVTREDI